MRGVLAACRFVRSLQSDRPRERCLAKPRCGRVPANTPEGRRASGVLGQSAQGGGQFRGRRDPPGLLQAAASGSACRWGRAWGACTWNRFDGGVGARPKAGAGEREAIGTISCGTRSAQLQPSSFAASLQLYNPLTGFCLSPLSGCGAKPPTFFRMGFGLKGLGSKIKSIGSALVVSAPPSTILPSRPGSGCHSLHSAPPPHPFLASPAHEDLTSQTPYPRAAAKAAAMNTRTARPPERNGKMFHPSRSTPSEEGPRPQERVLER